MKLLRLAAAALAVLFANAALAQYPARPIKLIVGFPPGGAPDLSAATTTSTASW
jgi:tripartite-type tricarboxylate transporter receptor subunit TctC